MDIERAIVKHQPSPQEKKIAEIQGKIELINRRRAELSDDILPTTWQGRARNQILKFLPQLREQLQEAPLASISAELRKVIFELYNSIPEILRDGKEIVAYADRVSELLEEVLSSPDDEDLLYELGDLLNQRAERDLNLSNREADEFIREVEQRDPEFKEKRKNSIISQAKRYLDVNGPEITAIKVHLIGSVEALRQLKIDYADIENHRVTIDRLHQNAGYIIRGQELGITSFNTVMGELELVVEAAKLVHDAAQASKDFADIVGPQRLQRLQSDADDLERKFLGLKEPERNGKILTPRTQTSED